MAQPYVSPSDYRLKESIAVFDEFDAEAESDEVVLATRPDLLSVTHHSHHDNKML